LSGEENSPSAEVARAWDALIRENIDLVKNEGTEVTFQIQRSDGGGPNAIQYRYLNTLRDMETFYGYLEFAKTGLYDAIIPVCFFDLMIREARQALDIPFIGPGESTMRLAAMMGVKFGVITQGDKTNWVVEDNIRNTVCGTMRSQ
jgi:Asp/Glu/hydantoin racemase